MFLFLKSGAQAIVSGGSIAVLVVLATIIPCLGPIIALIADAYTFAWARRRWLLRERERKEQGQPSVLDAAP